MSPEKTRDRSRVPPALGLVIVGLGASLAPLDIAVNVALPAITAHFKLALGDVQWLVICYVLVYGSLMLVCGKLGDLFGHRLIFRLGLLLSAFGCAACAMAPTWPLFLWARAGQGIGTALALSCAPALATSLFAENERTKGLAGFAAGQALAVDDRAAARRAAGAAHRLVGGLLDARADRAGRAGGVRAAAGADPRSTGVRCVGAHCCSPSA